MDSDIRRLHEASSRRSKAQQRHLSAGLGGAGEKRNKNRRSKRHEDVEYVRSSPSPDIPPPTHPRPFLDPSDIEDIDMPDEGRMERQTKHRRDDVRSSMPSGAGDGGRSVDTQVLTSSPHEQLSPAPAPTRRARKKQRSDTPSNQSLTSKHSRRSPASTHSSSSKSGRPSPDASRDVISPEHDAEPIETGVKTSVEQKTSQQKLLDIDESVDSDVNSDAGSDVPSSMPVVAAETPQRRARRRNNPGQVHGAIVL